MIFSGSKRRIPWQPPLRSCAARCLYRDIWFDKPPLYPLIYALWGAVSRVAAACGGRNFRLPIVLSRLSFRAGLAGEGAGYSTAACSRFVSPSIPSAVMALAPDLLTLPLHLAAVYLAWRGRPFIGPVAVSRCFSTARLCSLRLLACFGPLFVSGRFCCPEYRRRGLAQWNEALPPIGVKFRVWGSRYSADTFVTSPCGGNCTNGELAGVPLGLGDRRGCGVADSRHSSGGWSRYRSAAVTRACGFFLVTTFTSFRYLLSWARKGLRRCG